VTSSRFIQAAKPAAGMSLAAAEGKSSAAPAQ